MSESRLHRLWVSCFICQKNLITFVLSWGNADDVVGSTAAVESTAHSVAHGSERSWETEGRRTGFDRGS